MRTIEISGGLLAIVDDEMYDHLMRFKWWMHTKGYACTTVRAQGKKQTLLMHRLIMGNPEGMHIDHKDHNKLNNQKSNLRVCTRSQNEMNKRKRVNHSSKFKGVCVQSTRTKKNFVARVYVNGKRITKYFPFTSEGELAAAKAYRDMARQHYKDFAYTD